MTDIVGRLELRPMCHNHDPEQGPGLNCRESPIGDCLRAEAAAEIRNLRHWNSAIAVCADHTQDIVSVEPGSCVVCDLERLREQVRVAREALEWDRALFARFGKGEGLPQNALHAWTRVGDTLAQLEDTP